MKKKIFVNRDTRSGFRSSLKFLFWAAIGLVILVLFIPLTSRQKTGKEVAKKPTVEKGKVVKEIPRSLQPIAESLSRGQGESSEPPKEAETRPAAAPEAKPAGVATAPVPATSPKEKPPEPAASPQKVEPAPEPAAKNLASRTPPPEPAGNLTRKETQLPPPSIDTASREAQPAGVRKPEPTPPPTQETKPKTVASAQPPEKPAKPPAAEPHTTPKPPPAATAADSQKPAVTGGKTLYAVQVATLKDKHSAEELKKALQKKGFEVVVKTSGDPKQGQSFTLQLHPVDNMSKASTLMEQVKYVPQAKPSIVPVQPGN